MLPKCQHLVSRNVAQICNKEVLTAVNTAMEVNVEVNVFASRANSRGLKMAMVTLILLEERLFTTS